MDTTTSSIERELREEVKRAFPSLKDIKKKAQARIEKIVIEEALKRTRGNKTEAAELLKISYKAILYKIKEYGITLEPEDFSDQNIHVIIPEE